MATSAYVLERKLEQALDLLTPENRLVMSVCLATGLRLGDVLELRPEQLQEQFYITERKTGKRRRVNLSRRLLDALCSNCGRYWVFEGAKDPTKHRTRQAVWKDVKRAAKALRLSENLTPHSARKVYAVRLLDKYGDIEHVRRALNHDNAAVTMLYAMADRLPERKRRRQK